MKIIKEIKIDEAVSALKNGLVVVFPTDTVYGLIADASNKEAIENIFAIKKRPLEMVLPVFVSDIEMAKELAIISPEQEGELKKHWPGAYTFILERGNYKKELFGLDKKTIALRVPDYQALNEVLKKFGAPLVQTSANISGAGATGNIAEVISQFGNNDVKPDIIFDAGNLPESKPSTIIDLTKNEVLRK